MFQEQLFFNQPIHSWDVASVTDMSFAFFYATSFNQPLQMWDVSQVTAMGSMLRNAAGFNQTPWCTPSWGASPFPRSGFNDMSIRVLCCMQGEKLKGECEKCCQATTRATTTPKQSPATYAHMIRSLSSMELATAPSVHEVDLATMGKSVARAVRGGCRWTRQRPLTVSTSRLGATSPARASTFVSAATKDSIKIKKPSSTVCRK